MRFVLKLLPRRLKEEIALSIRRVASVPTGETFDARRYRQELDLLHYRVDELSTQLAVLSAQSSGLPEGISEPGAAVTERTDEEPLAAASAPRAVAAGD